MTQIAKGKRNGTVYREVRPRRSDVNLAVRLEQGGVVGQEIVIDYQGDEYKGVIVKLTDEGDYIVDTDNGRTVLAQKDMDVISLGSMKKKSMETERKKRFGFFKDGGKMAFGGMIDENNVSTGGILRMEELAPNETLDEFINNAKYIVNSLEDEGFEKDEIYTFLAHMMIRNTGTKTAMVRGGNIKTKNLFDLEKGDVFEITHPNHTVRGQLFQYIDLSDKYNVPGKYGKITIKAFPFPSKEAINNNPKKGAQYIADIKDGDFEILDPEDAKFLLDRYREKLEMKYSMSKYNYAEGGGVHTMPDGRVMLNSAHYAGGVGNVLDELGYYEEGDFYIVSDLKENESYIQKTLKKAGISFTKEYFKDGFGQESVEFKIKKESTMATGGGVGRIKIGDKVEVIYANDYNAEKYEIGDVFEVRHISQTGSDNSSYVSADINYQFHPSDVKLVEKMGTGGGVGANLNYDGFDKKFADKLKILATKKFTGPDNYKCTEWGVKKIETNKRRFFRNNQLIVEEIQPITAAVDFKGINTRKQCSYPSFLSESKVDDLLAGKKVGEFKIMSEQKMVNGGGVFSKGRVVLADGKGVGGNKNKTYQLIKFDYTDGSGDEGFEIREMPSNKVMSQGTNYGSVLQYFNLYTGKFANGGGVDDKKTISLFWRYENTGNKQIEDLKSQIVKIVKGNAFMNSKFVKHNPKLTEFENTDIFAYWNDLDKGVYDDKKDVKQDWAKLEKLHDKIVETRKKYNLDVFKTKFPNWYKEASKYKLVDFTDNKEYSVTIETPYAGSSRYDDIQKEKEIIQNVTNASPYPYKNKSGLRGSELKLNFSKSSKMSEGGSMSGWKHKMVKGGKIGEIGVTYFIGRPSVDKVGRFNTRMATWETCVVEENGYKRYSTQSIKFSAGSATDLKVNGIKITKSEFDKLTF